jgi:uncharacterized protein YutD
MNQNEEITIQEYQEMKNERIEELKDYIAEICDIIHMELPLRFQDKWLEVMTEKGLYTPHVDE